MSDDDWSKPEKRKSVPRREQRLKTDKLDETRICVECGAEFHPWKKGPGLCCSKPCAGRYNLKRRGADRAGALYRWQQKGTADD